MLSLKAFHVVFIVLSLVLVFGLAWWAGPAWAKALWLTAGLALGGYLFWFFKKMKRLA